MRTYTVADAILDTLKAHGVERIFGYPGGAILPFYDALPYHKEIHHVLVRNEQAAAFAAQGVARSTQKIGVCCATSGPGATNLITGIADAFMDSIPLLCITGQVPLSMIGKDMFQEVDMTGITLNITKHNYLLDDPKKTVSVVTEAIAIALSGRPGPVHIDVPKDIMASAHPEHFEIPKIELKNDPQQKAFLPIENSVINDLFETIHSAKKPVLLIGQGVKHSKATKELKKFIETLNIPTIWTILGKGILDPNMKQNLGMLGMHGVFHANQAMHEADCIINIGSRFDDRIVGTYASFGKHAKIIHVDIDQAELNKVVHAQFPIHADAKQFLNQMLSHPKISELKIEDWWNHIEHWKQEKPYEKETDNFTIRSVLSALDKEIVKNPEQFIVVPDVGQHQMWTSLSCSLSSSQNWLASGGAGTMGFSLPTSIGAAFAHPEKIVLSLSGDGGIQMNIQELAVLKDHNLNIKVIILNNSFLGMVRQWQELFYEHNYSQVNISSPDYPKIGEAYGIESFRVKSKEEIPAILKKILHTKGPQLIEFIVEKEDNVFPMVPGGKTLGETRIQ